jgi:hypothetical protein
MDRPSRKKLIRIGLWIFLVALGAFSGYTTIVPSAAMLHPGSPAELAGMLAPAVGMFLGGFCLIIEGRKRLCETKDPPPVGKGGKNPPD